jgi:hypothetical protein
MTYNVPDYRIPFFQPVTSDHHAFDKYVIPNAQLSEEFLAIVYKIHKIKEARKERFPLAVVTLHFIFPVLKPTPILLFY